MKTFLVKIDFDAGSQDKQIVHLIRATDKSTAIAIALEHEKCNIHTVLDSCYLESTDSFLHAINEVTEVDPNELPLLKKLLHACQASLNLQFNIAA